MIENESFVKMPLGHIAREKLFDILDTLKVVKEFLCAAALFVAIISRALTEEILFC
jgi:hypothetical protein